MPNEHNLHTAAYLCIVHCSPVFIFWCMKTGHITKLIPSQTGFLSLLTAHKWPPHFPDLNPVEHLSGCGGGRDLDHGCSWLNCCSCGMLLCQCGPISPRNISSTLLNLSHDVLRRFRRQQGEIVLTTLLVI